MEGGKNYRYAIKVGYADGRTITVFRELVNFIDCVKALEKIFGDHNGVPIAPRLAMLGKRYPHPLPYPTPFPIPNLALQCPATAEAPHTNNTRLHAVL